MPKKASIDYANELRKIERRDKIVTPDAVVKAASDPKNPMHRDPKFHWGDDSKAAYSYRLDVARDIISSVRVTVQVKDIRIMVPMYVRDPNAPPRNQGYIPMSGVSRSRKSSSEVLEHEASCAMAHLRRYRDLVATLGGDQEILELIERFERLHGLMVEAA